MYFFFFFIKKKRKRKRSPRNNQITPQHPLLSSRDFLPLMQQTTLPMAMQQRHAHAGRHGDRFWGAVFARGLRVEDGFAAGAGGEVDEEGPCCVGFFC